MHKLASDFKVCQDIKINPKDCQIVLVRGFYNRPIIADSVFFSRDEKFGKLAGYPANYTIALQKVLRKQESELVTPSTEYLSIRKGSDYNHQAKSEDVTKMEIKKAPPKDGDLFENLSDEQG